MFKMRHLRSCDAAASGIPRDAAFMLREKRMVFPAAGQRSPNRAGRVW